MPSVHLTGSAVDTCQRTRRHLAHVDAHPKSKWRVIPIQAVTERVIADGAAGALVNRDSENATVVHFAARRATSTGHVTKLYLHRSS